MRLDPLPTVAGTPYQGGFYAGLLLVSGHMFALIVAPKAEGETQSQWIHDYTPVPGANSYCDGMANTVAMAEAGSELGNWARGLAIGGFTDWHVPARDQLEILYRVFKPTEEPNSVYRHGDNPSSALPGYPYTSAEPAQTSAPAFQAGGAEAFEEEWYWSSTQYSDGCAWGQDFYGGYQGGYGKSYEGRVRAVRRLTA